MNASPFDPPIGPEPSESSRSSLPVRLAVAAVIVMLLLLAVAIAEWVARGEVARAIGDEVRASSEWPATQRIDVEVEGLVLPQLLTQRLDTVRLSSDNLNVGPLGGDVSVTVHDLPVGSVGEIGAAEGQVRLSGPQLSALVPDTGVASFDVFFRDYELVFSADMTLAGQTTSFGVAVIPGFEGGRVTTALSSMTLGDRTVTAEEMAAEAGGEAAAFRPMAVCIADAIPAGFRVDDLRVEGQALVIDVTIDRRILADPSLQLTGSCS